jgi:hypothetical protein
MFMNFKSLFLLAAVALAVRPAVGIDTARTRNGDAHIFTSDVENFWNAIDVWKRSGDHSSGALVEALKVGYFQKASPGLASFIPGRILGPEELASAYLANVSYYEDVRPATLELSTQAANLRALFTALQQDYPQATLPVVYLVIGRRTSGGTSTEAGLVVGAEMFSPRSSSRLHPDDFVSLVIHELTHYQQRARGRHLVESDSLLRIAMAEGDADFIAEHYVGHHIDEAQKAYGDGHEQELWTKFRAQLHSAGPGDWMYNGDRVAAGVPPDLGYYIGYKICQAYYERAKNKRAALQTLLSLTNEQAILSSSHYAERFR